MQSSSAATRIKVQLNGQTYTWTGHNWVDGFFVKPPTSIIRELNLLVDSQLALNDDAVTDVYELVRRAGESRDAAQYDRAERLARRALALEPKNHTGAAVLCSCLRAHGRPLEALAETEKFMPTGNAALLTSRAAAYCDIREWEKAKQSVGRSLAIQKSDEAFNVVRRIKSVRPDLY